MEYKVFGKTYLCKRAVSYPMRKIKNATLRELYKLFTAYVDNVHTDLDTVEVHFLEDDDGTVDLLWTCSHYEATFLEDLMGLLHFMAEIRYFLGDVFVSLDLLDAVAEKLIVRIIVKASPFSLQYKFPDTPNKIAYKVEEGG
jgi:hypothetical protein